MTHPNRVFAARADLISFHPEFSTTEKGAEFVAGLLDDARALWAVRVLDAWAWANNERWDMRAYPDDDGEEPHTATLGFDEDDYHSATTPDAARLAAAEAVFPTLDAATRAKLGECP